jgi:hypothetical protein
VVDAVKISSERFQEWAAECNRGKEIHFWADESEAESWLLDE